MVKASTTGKTSRARKMTPAVKASLVADSLLQAKRDLQRAHRTQKEITALANQLARRVRSADAALVELGATLMARASKLVERRPGPVEQTTNDDSSGIAALNPIV